MRRYIQTLSYSAIWCSLVFSLAFAYTETLDSAHSGPAGPDNPFFTEVLVNGINVPSWFKIDTNLYMGPTQKVYFYDNTRGIISEVINRTVQVGQKTYDNKGNLIRSYNFITDAYGYLAGIHDYTDYTYDDNNRLSGYTLIKRKSNGTPVEVEQYNDFVYSADGTVVGYTCVQRTADGAFILSSDYQNITYYPSGAVSSYKRTDRDLGREIVSNLAYNFYENGNVLAYTEQAYEGGQASAVYEYSGYTYDALGKVLGYTRVDKNPSGAVVASRLYSNFSYYESGKVSSYSMLVKNPSGAATNNYTYNYDSNGLLTGYTDQVYANGQPSTVYEYSGYTYDNAGQITGYIRVDRNASGDAVASHAYSEFIYYVDGKVSAYTLVNKDAAGNVTGNYSYGYNVNGELRGYTYKAYANGQVSAISEYLDYTYDAQGRLAGYVQLDKDGQGSLLRRFEYTSYAYDSQSRMVSYARIDKDALGALLGTYEYSNYTYDASGAVASYEWARKDAGGNIIERGRWPARQGYRR